LITSLLLLLLLLLLLVWCLQGGIQCQGVAGATGKRS